MASIAGLYPSNNIGQSTGFYPSTNNRIQISSGEASRISTADNFHTRAILI
jgi:hypothetical protein